MNLMTDCLFVGFGGMIGAMSRYLLTVSTAKVQTGFPVTTLFINIIGAFLIGLIAAVTGKHINLEPQMQLFLKVGLCGGFTTFSTFSMETFNLMQNGRPDIGILYATLSVMLCIAAVACSQMVVR